jgi:hypothetical protein
MEIRAASFSKTCLSADQRVKIVWMTQDKIGLSSFEPLKVYLCSPFGGICISSLRAIHGPRSGEEDDSLDS